MNIIDEKLNHLKYLQNKREHYNMELKKRIDGFQNDPKLLQIRGKINYQKEIGCKKAVMFLVLLIIGFGFSITRPISNPIIPILWAIISVTHPLLFLSCKSYKKLFDTKKLKELNIEYLTTKKELQEKQIKPLQYRLAKSTEYLFHLNELISNFEQESLELQNEDWNKRTFTEEEISLYQFHEAIYQEDKQSIQKRYGEMKVSTGKKSN